jgi:glycosyltransferase involved in cell wall biosynthesis
VLHEHFADPQMPAYQALADRLLRHRTDGAIAVSRSTREFLVHERFVPADRVRLIWNGAPLDEFAPAPRDRALRVRHDLGIPDDALVVGSIGRLSAQKGHRFLVEAAGRLLPGRPQARVLVAGDGDLMADLRQQAAALGIADRVVFAGHRTDVPDLLGALDVFCISSLYEGTPLALFEAMAAGKAIVSTSVDGCREVLEDGVTGVLVPPADATALASGLDGVLGDAALREGLGRRALAASRRYDVRACVDQMQDFYDDLLSGGRR